jgi:hypothetical protein
MYQMMRNLERNAFKSEYPSRNSCRGCYITQIPYNSLAKVSYIGELQRISSGG